MLWLFLEYYAVKAEEKMPVSFWMQMMQNCINNQTTSHGGSHPSRDTNDHRKYVEAQER